MEKNLGITLDENDMKVIFYSSNEADGYMTLIQVKDTYFLLKKDCHNSQEIFQTLKLCNEKIFF
jgi:hypothetical protein